MNVTDQSRAQDRWDEVEEALRKSQSLATAAEFAVSVMHEINNPLEAISNLAYLVEISAGNAGKVREYIRMLEEQLALVRSIARQTLSFYKGANVIQPVNLVSLAEAALRIHHQKITAKQVRLLRKLPQDATVNVHSGELLQVISNLISNALDALPHSGTLHLRIRKSSGAVHVTIADNGHGIPKTALSTVFEPFFTTKKDAGTGLGLAISKAIVERHKGKIHTRSSVRKGSSGTVFRISLPMEEAIQLAA